MTIMPTINMIAHATASLIFLGPPAKFRTAL